MKEVYHQKFLSRLEIFWKNAFPFIFHLFFLLPLFPSYFIRTVPRRFFSASFSRHSFPPILNGQTGIAFSPAFPIAPLKHLATHCLPVFVFLYFFVIFAPLEFKDQEVRRRWRNKTVSLHRFLLGPPVPGACGHHTCWASAAPA